MAMQNTTPNDAPTDPRETDDGELDSIQILDEKQWERIHAYSVRRRGFSGERDGRVLEEEVADGVTLVLDMDPDFQIFNLHVDPDEAPDEYHIPEHPGDYFSNLGETCDRIRREVSDAIGYPVVFQVEEAMPDENPHRWVGEL